VNAEGQREGRKVSSVQILGGVDTNGPALYQIDQEGVPMRISYGALGSGSINALSVLESERRKYRLRNLSATAISADIGVASADVDNMANNAIFEGHCENITVSEAINIVRKAVRSGILNDMGSGSHVDLCVLTNSNSSIGSVGSGVGGSGSGGSITDGASGNSGGGVFVRQWREKMDSTWSADRISTGITSTSTTVASDHEKSAADTTNTTTDLSSALGKRIFSRIRPVRRILHDTVQESDEYNHIDDFVSFNVEFV